jgi:hypothetical protein
VAELVGREAVRHVGHFWLILCLFFHLFENCPHRFLDQDDALLKSAILPQSAAGHDEGIGIAHPFMAIG